MQYCIYLRKSRADVEAEAHGEEETLARHKKALLELSKKLHLSIAKIYPEVVSGETIAARPVMQQLLNDVEQGLWEGVLVMEVERLARGDTIDQGIVAQTFKFSNTKIITPMKTYDPSNEYDEEYFEFGLFMSRREYKTINRRLQRGRLASVKEGKYVANRPPYGYLRKKIESDKGFTLIPNDEQAQIVKMIYELYTQGEKQPDGSYKRLGVSLIVRKLNALKIAPQRGDVWVTPSVRDILINPVYIGKVRWNWRPAIKKMEDGQVTIARPRNKNEDCVIVDGLHEGIIDKGTWEIAQKYMSQNPPRPLVKNKTIQNPLAGLIICGKCGRRMVRRPYHGGYEDTLMCPVTSCDNVSSSLRLVEQHLLKSLEDWLQNYRVKVKDKGSRDTKIELDVKKTAIDKIDIELKKLEKQLSSIYDFLEQGIYTTDTFLERSNNLTARANNLKDEKAVLQKELENNIAQEENQKSFIPKVEHVLEVYYTLPTAQAKNDTLREVLEKVVYTKNVNGRWHNKPDDFDLLIYPKLPKPLS